MKATSDDTLVLTQHCSDRKGEHDFELRMLYERGVPAPPYRDPEALAAKIGQVYGTASQFDILFSDYSRSRPDLFVMQSLDPRSTWLEIVEDERQVGVACLTEINPFWDAQGHFTFWDRILPGREPLMLRIVEWAMNRYSLPRISAELPVFSKHTQRFIERLGMKREGVKREAILRHGKRMDLVLYGILKSEMEEAIWALDQK